MIWALIALYVGGSNFIGLFMPRRFANGLTGKITKRWLKNQNIRHLVRYFGWLGFFGLAYKPSWSEYDPIWVVFWLVACLFVLDDYIFGDDDSWKKRWESVKNKIKWKMVLPAPATQDARGA